jgi:hypothetical protein
MKDFIPYEEALVLKELGFDEPCFRFQNNISHIIEEKGWLNWNEVEQFISLPLFSQAFRFFREKYDLHQHIEYIKIADRYDYWVGLNFKYTTTYEDAELQCLRKLIEIAKQKP